MSEVAWEGLGLSDNHDKHKQMPRCTFKNQICWSAWLICPLSKTQRPSVPLRHCWVPLCLEYLTRKLAVAVQVWKSLQPSEWSIIRAINWKISAYVILLMLTCFCVKALFIIGWRRTILWSKHVFTALPHKVWSHLPLSTFFFFCSCAAASWFLRICWPTS